VDIRVPSIVGALVMINSAAFREFFGFIDLYRINFIKIWFLLLRIKNMVLIFFSFDSVIFVQ